MAGRSAGQTAAGMRRHTFRSRAVARAAAAVILGARPDDGMHDAARRVDAARARDRRRSSWPPCCRRCIPAVAGVSRRRRALPCGIGETEGAASRARCAGAARSRFLPARRGRRGCDYVYVLRRAAPGALELREQAAIEVPDGDRIRALLRWRSSMARVAAGRKSPSIQRDGDGYVVSEKPREGSTIRAAAAHTVAHRAHRGHDITYSTSACWEAGVALRRGIRRCRHEERYGVSRPRELLFYRSRRRDQHTWVPRVVAVVGILSPAWPPRHALPQGNARRAPRRRTSSCAPPSSLSAGRGRHVARRPACR